MSDDPYEPLLYAAFTLKKRGFDISADVVLGAKARIEEQAAEIERLRAASEALINIVEGINGAMNHGTFRAERSNLRMKDTAEWTRFYVAVRSEPPK